MGILDFLDNPNALSNLLGIAPSGMGDLSGTPNAGPTSQPGGIGSDYGRSPPSAPVPMPPRDPRTALPNGGIGSDYAGGFQPQSPPQQPMPPIGEGGVGGVDVLTPNGAGNASPPMSTMTPDYANSQVPLPPPRPPGAPQVGSLPLPPAQGQNAPGQPAQNPLHMLAPGANGPTDLSARTGNTPLNIAPPNPGGPPMPPQIGNTGPQTMSQGGGLAGVLGINPNQMRATFGGLGKGLSAVGSLPAGAKPGQAFAAGAGGALQGTTAMQEQQKKLAFDQSSTSLKDYLAMRNQIGDDGKGGPGTTEGMRAAQAQYLQARAKSLETMTASGGSKGYQNTPEYKVLRVEEDAGKWANGQQIMLQKRWQLNGSSPEEQKQDLDDLAKKVDQFKQNLYKTSGIDPKQAEKIKDMGTSATNPFDVKDFKGTQQQQLEQFHARVPMGAWFKDQNGIVRQRTVPPPGANAQPSSAPPAGVNGQVNNDDYLAMQPVQ